MKVSPLVDSLDSPFLPFLQLFEEPHGSQFGLRSQAVSLTSGRHLVWAWRLEIEQHFCSLSLHKRMYVHVVILHSFWVEVIGWS